MLICIYYKDTSSWFFNPSNALCLEALKRPALSPDQFKMSLDLLLLVTRALEDANIQYTLYGGTLLGSWRHHCFIPWDDDLDIFVPQSNSSALLDVLGVGENGRFAFIVSNLRLLRLLLEQTC